MQIAVGTAIIIANALTLALAASILGMKLWFGRRPA